MKVLGYADKQVLAKIAFNSKQLKLVESITENNYIEKFNTSFTSGNEWSGSPPLMEKFE